MDPGVTAWMTCRFRTDSALHSGVEGFRRSLLEQRVDPCQIAVDPRREVLQPFGVVLQPALHQSNAAPLHIEVIVEPVQGVHQSLSISSHAQRLSVRISARKFLLRQSLPEQERFEESRLSCAFAQIRAGAIAGRSVKRPDRRAGEASRSGTVQGLERCQSWSRRPPGWTSDQDPGDAPAGVSPRLPPGGPG